MYKMKEDIWVNDIFEHIPVMLSEVIEYLKPQQNEIYLDCTFGAGGYSRAILESCNSKVVALDRDPSVSVQAKNFEKLYPNRFEFFNTNFAEAAEILKGKVFNGIVMDLGISSMQVDNADRGFSFMNDGPLDMRMASAGRTAADFINNASEEEIADVIFKYGEEKASRRIASKIVSERDITPILTTGRLAEIVRSCIKMQKGKIDKATKTFQAIRIYLNDELYSLEKFLIIAEDLLADGGRIVIVSFHSLEDAIVKSFFQKKSAKKVARSKYSKEPIIVEKDKNFIILTKKPLASSRTEVLANNRSRSAKLRAAIKIGGSNVIN